MDIVTANQLYGVLMLAFSLGLVHAFDADHIMAVTALAGKCSNISNSSGFSCRWAMGHGFALMLISLAVLIFGWAIPVELSDLAEQLVGGVLIVIGIWILWSLSGRRTGFLTRQDRKNIQHEHSHHQEDNQTQEANHEHKYSATFVGMLHGTAGSAPLLALLPISKFATPWHGVAYVLLFGAGVFIAMFVFGGLLGRMLSLAIKRGSQIITVMRSLIASCSVVYGTYLLKGVF